MSWGFEAWSQTGYFLGGLRPGSAQGTRAGAGAQGAAAATVWQAPSACAERLRESRCAFCRCLPPLGRAQGCAAGQAWWTAGRVASASRIASASRRTQLILGRPASPVALPAGRGAPAPRPRPSTPLSCRSGDGGNGLVGQTRSHACVDNGSSRCSMHSHKREQHDDYGGHQEDAGLSGVAPQKVRQGGCQENAARPGE